MCIFKPMWGKNLEKYVMGEMTSKRMLGLYYQNIICQARNPLKVNWHVLCMAHV